MLCDESAGLFYKLRSNAHGSDRFVPQEFMLRSTFFKASTIPSAFSIGIWDAD